MRNLCSLWMLALVAVLTTGPLLAQPRSPTVSEREKFEAEQSFKQADQDLRRSELELKREEQAGARWTSPLVLAIAAAAIAALGNAAIAFVNGRQQRALERERADANRTLEREKAQNQVELERDKAEAQRTLDARKAESDRILEIIKTGDTESAAENLQFLLDAGLVAKEGLGTRLDAFLTNRPKGRGPALPASSGRFRFEDGPETPADLSELSTSLQKFCGYLDGLGFDRPEREVSIAFKRDYENAHYEPDQRKLVIGLSFIDEPFAAYREYMHHILMETAGAAPQSNEWAMTIESGLADYFPASFMNTPYLGANAARALGLDRSYVRSLKLSEGFADIGPESWKDGQIWGSLFWEIRLKLGQAPADKILCDAWRTTSWPRQGAMAPSAFIQVMLGLTGDKTERMKAVLEDRGFPLTKRKAHPLNREDWA